MGGAFFRLLSLACVVFFLPVIALGENAGLQSKDTSTAVNSTFELSVKFHSKGRCMISDLDVIDGDLRHNDKAKLILSLEPLAARDFFARQAKTISVADIKAGKTEVFKVKNDGIAHPLGLYLCSVSDGATTCRDKPIADANQIYPKYYQTGLGLVGRPKAVPADYRAPDRTYFFQFLLVDGAQYSILSGDQLERSTYAEAKKQLTQRLRTSFEKEAVFQALDAASAINQKINSVQTQLGGKGELILNVPHVHCSGA